MSLKPDWPLNPIPKVTKPNVDSILYIPSDLYSFEDLKAPPSSVVAVMKNRWLSNGFKEGALQVRRTQIHASKLLL